MYKQTVKLKGGFGDTQIRCIERQKKHADKNTRRLAGVNLGPIPEESTVTCELEVVGEDRGALAITCGGLLFGPVPISLPLPYKVRT